MINSTKWAISTNYDTLSLQKTFHLLKTGKQWIISAFVLGKKNIMVEVTGEQEIAGRRNIDRGKL